MTNNEKNKQLVNELIQKENELEEQIHDDEPSLIATIEFEFGYSQITQLNLN